MHQELTRKVIQNGYLELEKEEKVQKMILLDQVNIQCLILSLMVQNILWQLKQVLLTQQKQVLHQVQVILFYLNENKIGQYNPSYKDGNPKYTMRMKPGSSRSESTPGPVHKYNN